MSLDDLIAGLPGEALLREGLADYQSGRCTIPACLVGVAQSRLRCAGLIAGEAACSVSEPEQQLYRLLRQEGGDAYSRYNALIRELVSFEQALEQRQNKHLRAVREKAQTRGDEGSTAAKPSATPDKLALAQQAFDRFYSRCFWFMRKDLRVGEEDLEWIIRGLRSHGNREAFLLAAKLCR